MATYNDARKIQDRINNLERRMLSIETASRMESATMSGGDLTVFDGGAINLRDGGELDVESDGSINIYGGNLVVRGTGTMTVDGTAEFRSTTSLSGNTTFGGALNITSGSLSLPTGSISNDALKEQLDIKYTSGTNGAFGLTTTTTTLITNTISAPSWATSASVFVSGYMFAKYTGVGTYSAYLSTNCAGSVSPNTSTVLRWNEKGVFGNTGKLTWSQNVSNVGSTITTTLRGRAARNGEMESSGDSYAILETLVFFMR